MDDAARHALNRQRARAFMMGLTDDLMPRAVKALLALAIPEHLSTPQTASDLARMTGTHPDALFRLLRYLASRGVLVAHPDGRFSLSPAGVFLRRDEPDSLLPFLRYAFSSDIGAPLDDLLYSVRTSQPAYHHRFGTGPYDKWANDPELGAAFDAFMEARVWEQTPLLPEFDLAGVRVVADVGGGTGTMLGSLLARQPSLRGILIDRPDVIARAHEVLRAAGIEDRCRLVGADFLESVVTGADVYVLSSVLHNWNDDDAVRILRNCCEAMGPSGRLIVLEALLPDAAVPHEAFVLDLVMLVVFGGRERSEEEFRTLMTRAGLRLSRSTPIGPALQLLEAQPNGPGSARA